MRTSLPALGVGFSSASGPLLHARAVRWLTDQEVRRIVGRGLLAPPRASGFVIVRSTRRRCRPLAFPLFGGGCRLLHGPDVHLLFVSFASTQTTSHRVAFSVRCQVAMLLLCALFVISGTTVTKRTTIDHGASLHRTRPTPLIERRSSIVVDRRIRMRRKRRTDRPQRSSGSVGSFLFARCRFFLTYRRDPEPASIP